jgi:hypothetical protein
LAGKSFMSEVGSEATCGSWEQGKMVAAYEWKARRDIRNQAWSHRFYRVLRALRWLLDDELVYNLHSPYGFLLRGMGTVLSVNIHRYHLVGKYMTQPHTLRPRICLSWQHISTVCSLRKAK